MPALRTRVQTLGSCEAYDGVLSSQPRSVNSKSTRGIQNAKRRIKGQHNLMRLMRQTKPAAEKLLIILQCCSVTTHVHWSQISGMQTCIATTLMSQMQQLAVPSL